MATSNEPIIGRALWYSLLLYVVSLGTMKPVLVIAGQRSAPGDLVFALVVMLWLAAILTGRMKFCRHSVVVATVIFFAATCVSAIFSDEPTRSFGKLAGVAYLAAVAIITFHSIDSESRLRQLLLAFLIGAAIPAAVGIAGIFIFYVFPLPEILGPIMHHYGSVPVGNFPRLSSTFVSASMFMNYLSVAIVFLIVARIRGWLSRTWFVPGIILLSVCCLFTVSIGLGALFLILGIYLGETVVMTKFGIKQALRGGGFMVATLFLVIAPFALRPHSTATYSITEPLFGTVLYPSPRSMVWEQAFSTFRDDPLTGVGIGHTVANVKFQNTDGTYSLLTDAHNTFLNIAAQTEFVGMTALIFLCSQVLLSAFRRGDGSATFYDVKRWLGIAFVSSFVYQGLTGSFEDARHLWLLIGVITAASAISKEPKQFAAQNDLLYS